MAETFDELASRLRDAVVPGAGGRLLDRGLARGLIWTDGTVPEGGPEFPERLSEDLLDYAHGVMALALRLRGLSRQASPLERAFLVAGEAIEAAVHRGEERPDRGFHRVTAAVAFHLGRFAARAYSMLPAAAEAQNLAPTEVALVQLLRRRLDALHGAFSGWLLDPSHGDGTIATRLHDDDEFDQGDAIHLVLTNSFMRGLALFDHALAAGLPELATAAGARLRATAETARELNSVSHWWTATMASHLVEDLWETSFHNQVPELPPDDPDHERWREIRRGYIQRLHRASRAAIELWPSQVKAAKRAVDLDDDLVVALPTSAGKTRIAELCILRTLAAQKRVVYVTPLRALSAQIERDLGDSLKPLGFSVSSLYGAAGIESGDEETLRQGQVVVSTPEKLDFALRNDASVIADIGLIVLDEGHMLGPNEREVRYEALVQKLVRRADAQSRRIVCLSALFPTPKEMNDLVAWLRADEPGDPIHSSWRPTRQRFGVLQWGRGAARLDLKVEEETPFVPRFIEAESPPSGSRRRKAFPDNKNELTLAAAWRFVEQDKNVLIYCALRKSVETLGRLTLECVQRGLLRSLGKSHQRVTDAMAIGTEWLGANHPAVACLEHGVAVHHGGLPRPFLTEVERLLRSGDCRVTIASPTLAQGLNLSASVLLVPSIWRNREKIPAAEFANVAGRAGRAFVDVEGLVLHIVWEKTASKSRYAIGNWEKLVADAKAPAIASGILQLAVNILKRIAVKAGVEPLEVLEYVTGHADAWDFDGAYATALDVDASGWARDVASLDAAILALLDGDTDDAGVEAGLGDVLDGSLFSRELAREEAKVQEVIRSFVTLRAKRIWAETSAAQRKGYHAAGVGLEAGKFIDTNLATLVAQLVQAEEAVVTGDAAALGRAVVTFAELAFQISPFRPPKELPTRWREALVAWLAGQPSSDVLALCEGDGVDLIQEALAYRLPWAMEAVRVHGLSLQDENVESLMGLAALAVEAGSSNISIITLTRAGLASREAAAAAVQSTGADFTDNVEMRVWLASESVEQLSDTPDWPTERSRPAWLQFYEGERHAYRRGWSREIQRLDVSWNGKAPAPGEPVVVEPAVDAAGSVLSPDFELLGSLSVETTRPRRDIVQAVVSADGRSVDVEYFGPRT
jgi:hypothetical protein